MTSKTDKDVEKILKSGGPSAAAAIFMRRYARTGTARYLSEAAKLSAALSGQPDLLNELISNVSRALFVDGAKLGAERIIKIRFGNLAPGYFQAVDDTAKALSVTPARNDAAQDRILIVSKQILGPLHAPTLAVLEIARRLKQDSGAEVMVLDARDYSTANGLKLDQAFMPNFKDADGPVMMEHQGVEIPVNHATRGAYGRALFQEWLDVAEDFAPTAVLSQASENFAGDLLSFRYPTVFIPSQQDEPLSRAHVITDRFGQFAKSQLEKRGYLPDGHVIRQCEYRLNAIPDKTEPKTKADLKVPDDGFVFVVAGNRLNEEIDDEFAAILGDILRGDTKAYLLICGADSLQFASAFAGVAQRVRAMNFAADLRGLYEACDVYLNPPRRGGGRTAFLAAVERLPVLTLDGGDVAGLIGAEHCLPDIDAMKDEAVALIHHTDRRAAHRDRMEALNREVFSRKDATGKVMGLVGEAKSIAAAGASERAAA